MKKFQWPLRAFLFICFLQIISCTKAVDTTSDASISIQTSDDLTFPVTNEFTDCRIRRIYQQNRDGDIFNGLFTYNTQGNPISLTYTTNNIGVFDIYFKYDKQNRLVETRRGYEENTPFAGERHVYVYDANNRIIQDTMINGLAYNDEMHREYVWVSTFTYDTQGRIIKENIKNLLNTAPLHPTRNPTFTYDSRGNLAVAGWKSSSYDNKVSIFRSHPIFQFIFRNYSRNNAAPQANIIRRDCL